MMPAMTISMHCGLQAAIMDLETVIVARTQLFVPWVTDLANLFVQARKVQSAEHVGS